MKKNLAIIMLSLKYGLLNYGLHVTSENRVASKVEVFDGDDLMGGGYTPGRSKDMNDYLFSY